VVAATPTKTPAPIRDNVAAAARDYPGRVAMEMVGPTNRDAGQLLKDRYIPQG